MSLRVKIQLGANVFEVEGDFTFNDEFAATFRTWINAQNELPGQLDALAEQLDQQTTVLGDAVVAHTPPA